MGKKNRNNEAGKDPLPPPPAEKALCWELYFGLQSEYCIHKTRDESLAILRKKSPSVIVKAKRALTWEELDQKDFANEKEAALLLMRAVALLDTTSRNSKLLSTIKGFLMLSRSALWLARKAHFKYNIEAPPTKVNELMKTFKKVELGMNGIIQECLVMVINDHERVNHSLILTRLAWHVTNYIASENGEYARPAMAEGWLLATEVSLMLAELEASISQSKATKIRPKGRMGPLGDDVEGAREEQMTKEFWRVSIPGNIFRDPEEANMMTYLADYWWGQDNRTSFTILVHCLLQGGRQWVRFCRLATDSTRMDQWDRVGSIERDLNRRAAAALMSFEKNNPDPSPEVAQKIDTLRRLFPGSEFDPTEEFVKSLTVQEDDEDVVWCISCYLGFGEKNRTLVSIMDDTTPYGRWKGQVLGGESIVGSDPKSYRRPTAKELYKMLLKAMAGSGDENRCFTGPPRRPERVVVSYRLHETFDELQDLLTRISVYSTLEPEETLRWNCINNGTDFETGGAPKTEQTLTGQRVGIYGLLNRTDLNGRVGKVVKWHEGQGRWEVKLVKILPDEKGGTIAIKPTNLTQCPSSFLGIDDYLIYRMRLEAWSVSDDDDDERPSKDDDAKMEILLDKLRVQGSVSPDSNCAICQDDFGDAKGQRAISLPCDHAFHLTCVLPWIKNEKMECPCCRTQF